MTKPEPNIRAGWHAASGDRWREQRRERVRRLHAQGLTVRQTADRLGLTSQQVVADLRAVWGPDGPPRLRVVREAPSRRPVPLEVRPERAAIAYTAGRGWHMTEAPPGWLLDILAEVD